MITIHQIENLFHKLPTFMFNHSGWFIAGGAVTSYIYSDIDVYFESEQAYKAMHAEFLKRDNNPYETSNASSFHVTDGAFTSSTFQLVCRNFGTPTQILADFDLNICRNAVLPDRTLIQTRESFFPMYLDLNNLRANSVSRLIKYHHRDFLIDTNKLVDLIHHLIQNPDVEVGWYYEEQNTTPNTYKHLLYALFSCPAFTSTCILVIDSYPSETRTALYQELIHDYTEYPSSEYFSEEAQLRTASVNQSLATQLILDKYPELFI